MILLKPLLNKPTYRELIDKKLKKFFDRTVYLPLLEILRRDFGERFNALNVLLADIINGKIQYVEKGFVGQFSAQSSKELKSIGAKFSKRTKSWVIKKIVSQAKCNKLYFPVLIFSRIPNKKF